MNRRGGAILLVLAAAALLAFAAIGALAAASELHRQELAERSILHAELAAESALARRLASWDAREHASRPFWLLDAAAAAGTLAFTHLQAAGAGNWLLRASAERVGPSGQLLARRERTLLLRARPPALPLHVPLTARGAVQLGAGVQLDATGTQPPGWGCAAAPPPALANLALFPGATVSGAGPATLIDIGDSVETALLSSLALATSAGARILNPTLRHASLVAPTLAASVGSPAGHCALGAPADSAPSLAWGDPARPAPCADYLPYVHVQGDLTGPAGAGQGILVVDGDLSIGGPLEWAGLIVVRGNVNVSGSGFRLYGALVILGAGPHVVGGDAHIAWSPCAIELAARANAEVTPVTGAAWSMLP